MPVLQWKMISVNLSRILAEQSLNDMIATSVPHMDSPDRQRLLGDLESRAGLNRPEQPVEVNMGLRLAKMGIGVKQAKVDE